MAKLKDLDELTAAINENDGVMTVYAADLRDMYGAERLGINVRENISKALSGRGLAHLPRKLPDNQNESVRVYRLGSSVAEIIDAVLHPSAKSDAKLRKVTKGNSEKVVAKIRELLEEEEG